MRKLQIFVVKTKKRFQLGLIRNSRYIADLVSENLLQHTLILTPPLPSSQAYILLEKWKNKLGGKLGLFWWYFIIHQQRYRMSVESVSTNEHLQEILEAVKGLLTGRLLSEQRLVITLRQHGFWPNDINRALDLGVYRGELIQLPGFQNGSWGRQICTRCNGEEVTSPPCIICGRQNCLMCLECSSMGSNRGCSIFLTTSRPLESATPMFVYLNLTYKLTAAQQEAAEELLEFWEKSEEKALVWAACGAGKTEVTFPLIQQVLKEGGQVLFAIPRQDIVREMEGRLQQAFPKITVAAHYGGQPWLAPGNLVVATTHQVLHFYHRFQLVILDEVDAFPYQGNEILRFGIQRALKREGQLVEMTATPYTQRRYERVITIPARYHGHPLPEPQLLIEKLPPWTILDAGNLPSSILDVLKRDDHPWLVFAPTIASCIALQSVLEESLGKEVGLCHSKEPNRVRTIKKLKNNNLDLLVTTSVLERGVNFPNVGVVVLYADHGIFSSSALVQIAGRVGRTKQAPNGTVLFVATRRTASMQKALRLIQQLNLEAKKRGLLHCETNT